MSKSTFATTEGAASAVLHLLADKEATLRAELAKIEQVRAILTDDEPAQRGGTGRPTHFPTHQEAVAIDTAAAPTPAPDTAPRRRGRPKGSGKKKDKP